MRATAVHRDQHLGAADVIGDFERLILEELREIRSDVGDLRADVAALKATEKPTPRALARDGGLTISAATLGGGLLWLLQHWAGK